MSVVTTGWSLMAVTWMVVVALVSTALGVPLESKTRHCTARVAAVAVGSSLVVLLKVTLRSTDW